MKEEALRFLGLLNRGGLTLFGAPLFGAKRLSLLLIADDASSRSQDELLALARKLDCPVLRGASQEELGDSLGYPALSGVGITQKKAATALEKKWQEGGNEYGKQEQQALSGK